MTDALVGLAVVALSVLGLGALALSQLGHWRRVMAPRPFPGPRRLRWGAAVLLGLAWLVSLAGQGVAMGSVFWVLALLPAGVGVAMMLSGRG